jgi:hypothetical protein
LFVERLGEVENIILEHQVFSRPCGEPVFVGVAERSFRTSLGAFSAKETAPEVKPESVFIFCDRVGGTRVNAGAAVFYAERRLDDWTAAKTIWERRFLRWIRDRSMPLLEARL